MSTSFIMEINSRNIQIHASATENYLVGKSLDQNTIKGAMETLENEVQPVKEPRDGDPMYRKNLAQALLYKVGMRALFHVIGAAALMDISWNFRQF